MQIPLKIVACRESEKVRMRTRLNMKAARKLKSQRPLEEIHKGRSFFFGILNPPPLFCV